MKVRKFVVSVHLALPSTQGPYTGCVCVGATKRKRTLTGRRIASQLRLVTPHGGSFCRER